MKILYVAFPCNPYVGSESKIGWNIPIESAKLNNDVSVVTIADMKENIEKYIRIKGNINIKFYYVDLPKIIKRILKRFPTIKLRLYHRKIYKLINEKIIKNNIIEIIHQITPIEFRSIGNYGKIKDAKFIVGPLGGGEEIPKVLKSYYKKNKMLEFLRKFLNIFYKYAYKITKKYKHIDYIMYANEETQSFLRLYDNKKNTGEVYSEVGLTEDEISHNNNVYDKEISKVNFIVVGRLIYRKGHRVLLDALKLLPKELDYKVSIIGDGNYKKTIKKIIDNDDILKEKVCILGKVDYEKMQDVYNKANCIIMPSIRETTGSVILEAMAHGIPVVAMNKFGAKILINEQNGWLYSGNSKKEVIHNLENIIHTIVSNPDILKKKGINAFNASKQYVFQNKAQHYNEIYTQLLSKE